MRRTHRLPTRFISWISLSGCFSLLLTSLAIVPLPLVSSKSALVSQGESNQGTNDKARKVKADPPQKGAPAANLPNLDEVRQRRDPEPEAPAAIPSTMRSKRKPLESRGGKRVGDPGTTGNGIGFRSGSDRDAFVRSNHARTKARTTAPPPLGDDQFIQNFFLLGVPALSESD